MKKKDIFKLLVSIVVCQLAGLIGVLFTSPAIPSWYAGLRKPPFSPPNWLFGPVWSLLYLLMGVALYLVWAKKETSQKKTALKFFGLQLVFNSLWSIIFFGLRSPALALVEIILLWILIALTINKFLGLSKKAAYLLLPYLGWVSFASVLNLAIVRLN